MTQTISGGPQVCIIIPTYNHIAFLPEVLKGVRKLSYPVIVVDDGSTDKTPEFLEAQAGVTVITLPRNQGKGRALDAGLRHAHEKGYALAVCIDADGQHNPADIPRLIDAAQGRNDTIVIGAREFGQDTAPGKSRFGRHFSNFWIWVETGCNLPDTQSGFRLYPVEAMTRLIVRTARYGWEVEALTRAIWGGVRVVSIAVDVSYAAKKDSHFRMGWDFFLVSCVNTYLVFRRLMPLGHKRVVPQDQPAWPKGFKARLRFLWEHHLWQSGQTPSEKAMALGIGVFCGIVPAWGWQTVLALYLAQRLHLNKVLTLAGANISIPPMIPLILYASLVLGRWVLIQEWRWQIPLADVSRETIRVYLKEFFVGSTLLAVAAGILFGLLSYFMFKWAAKKKTDRIHD